MKSNLPMYQKKKPFNKMICMKNMDNGTKFDKSTKYGGMDACKYYIERKKEEHID